MATLGWARCTDNVADVLRRGAWYPIVEESADGHIQVDVRGRRVRLSTADVSLRREPPERWSIVVRTGVLRPTLGGQGKEVVNTARHARVRRVRRDCPGGLVGDVLSAACGSGI